MKNRRKEIDHARAEKRSEVANLQEQIPRLGIRPNSGWRIHTSANSSTLKSTSQSGSCLGSGREPRLNGLGLARTARTALRVGDMRVLYVLSSGDPLEVLQAVVTPVAVYVVDLAALTGLARKPEGLGDCAVHARRLPRNSDAHVPAPRGRRRVDDAARVTVATVTRDSRPVGVDGPPLLTIKQGRLRGVGESHFVARLWIHGARLQAPAPSALVARLTAAQQ